MYKKIVAIIVVFVLVLSFSSNIIAQEPMTLTLMRFFGDCSEQYADVTDLDGLTSECSIITVLTNIWNDEHPDIQIETIFAEWPGTTQLNAAIAAGTPPDIAVLHGRRIPIYASRGALTPMTDAFTSVGIDLNDFTEGAADFGMYQGEFYGLPFDLAATIWHVNLDLWAEAGLVDENGQPMIPTTYEEFMVAGQAVFDATGKPIAEMAGQAATVRPFTAFIYQLGGSLADENGNPTVNTPEAVQALTYLIEMQEAGYITRPYDQIDAETSIENFTNGESAGLIEGTWRVNLFDSQIADGTAAFENYYVADFPQIFGGQGTFAGSHNWIVPLGVNADPVRVEAAAQFIKFLSDNSVVWARVGHGMTRRSIIESDAFQGLPHRAEYASMSETVRSVPREVWGNAFWDIVHEEIESVLLGVKSPEQGLVDAQSRLDDFILFQS
ncbi:MAG: extracellular solute-binding protein [Anaerolineae bacterium]|nr:extracellular solute-binding protein [Anaerolineae bacterium]